VASFVWMPLTEPTYKRTRLCRSRLASEDSEPEGTANLSPSRLGAFSRRMKPSGAAAQRRARPGKPAWTRKGRACRIEDAGMAAGSLAAADLSEGRNRAAKPRPTTSPDRPVRR